MTTNNLFESVHKLVKVKIHLHHSHVTGEIIGYVHDFCNWVVRENSEVISLLHIIFLNLISFFY